MELRKTVEVYLYTCDIADKLIVELIKRQPYAFFRLKYRDSAL